jgi:Fe-S cluster biogenesis protein NfuA
VSIATGGAAKRLEELLAGFSTPSDEQPGAVRDGIDSRERAEELVRTVVAFYGEGLERLLSILYAELGDRADEFFTRLCDDKLVEGLLVLHGLHPLSLEDRIDAAMQSVLPYIKSHKGNMELSRIEGDVVYLRLEGSCESCPGSASTLKLAVERAILERAPEIREVRAEEMTLRILTSA